MPSLHNVSGLSQKKDTFMKRECETESCGTTPITWKPLSGAYFIASSASLGRGKIWLPYCRSI